MTGLSERPEWWVNARGEVIRHLDDQSARGYKPLHNPRKMEEQLGNTTLMRVCPSENGNMIVPVRAERVPGTLLWRWVYTGEKIRPTRAGTETRVY